MALQIRRGLETCSPRKYFNPGSRKCRRVFSVNKYEGYISKSALFIFSISSVTGKVQLVLLNQTSVSCGKLYIHL